MPERYPLTLSFLLHGDHGAGKSTLANTSPAPRLVLDAEGGSRFQEQRIVNWDPATSGPPVWDGTWDLCLVYVRTFDTILQVYQWLATGRHTFRSLVIDSITEIQKKLKDQIAGTEQMKMAQWGQLLAVMEDYVRKLRDLTFHPTNPLDAVIIVALTEEKSGKYKAWVQGALEKSMPSFVDVVGYYYMTLDAASGTASHNLLIAPINSVDAKSRSPRLTRQYGLIIPEPNIITMLDVMNTEPTLEAI